jgi:hypothetical protein
MPKLRFGGGAQRALGRRAMNIWILGGMAAFYAMLIAQLAYEIWRAPLVDDESQLSS